MMASRRKRNIIPLNIVQKRGRKHHISKEFVNITVHSAVAAPQSPHISGSGSANHGDGCIQDPMPEYLADQLEDQTRMLDSSQSQHTKRLVKQSEKWRESIHSALKAVIEGESMQSDETCSNCGAPANVRCRQCGPYAYFCSDCGISFHSRWNYHHYPELWKV